jgi:hypothetical protein
LAWRAGPWAEQSTNATQGLLVTLGWADGALVYEGPSHPFSPGSVKKILNQIKSSGKKL